MGLEPIQLVSRIRKDQDTQRLCKDRSKDRCPSVKEGDLRRTPPPVPSSPRDLLSSRLRTVGITLLLLERPVCGTL